MNGMDKTGQGVGVILPKWVTLPGWHAAGLLKQMAMREGSEIFGWDPRGNPLEGCGMHRRSGIVVGERFCFSRTGVLTCERR